MLILIDYINKIYVLWNEAPVPLPHYDFYNQCWSPTPTPRGAGT